MRPRLAIAVALTAVLSGVILLFRCSDTVSPARKTLLISVAADSTVWLNDTLRIRVSLQGANAGPIRYIWFVDDRPVPDTSADSILCEVFTVTDTGKRCIVVKAIGRGGTTSAPDSLHVRVLWQRPRVTLHDSPSIAVNDTELFIAVAVDSCGTIETFQWMIDSFPFMTQTDSVRWLFNDKADAHHTVRLAVMDNNGFVSDTDTVTIHVLLRRPVVSLAPHDTAIYSYTNLKLQATGYDSNGTIVRYCWTLDGHPAAVLSDSLTVNWDAGSSGTHYLTVTAVNNDSLASLPDTALITVKRGGPILTPLHDTTISSTDTLIITCQASDSNGTIVKYLWNFSSGTAWTDSTAMGSHPLTYAGNTQEQCVVGARDNHGLMGADTFIVRFIRPPDSLVVTIPQPCDTIFIPQETPACSLSFSFSAVDSDFNSLTYSLSWGIIPSSLAVVYQGPNQSARISEVGPGSYYWKVLAWDNFGHVISKNGSVTVLRQYLIGFVGHSIVAGMMGDGINGGFRGGILDSLRSHLGPYERVKPVGPVTPPFMSRSIVDDSCLALVGATGFEVWQSLSSIATQLTADIWVLMTGVNDGYDPEGLQYAIAIMDLMHQRNPNSRIYVLDGIPRPASDPVAPYWLAWFNQELADTIQVRQAAGTHVSMVEVDSALCPHGIFTDTFLPDSLHPDQVGYDTLVRYIYTRMQKSTPMAIP